MLKNYIKTAFRNMLRYKVYSSINIVGLAIGMSSAILIFLWVLSELTFDDFHQKLDDLYRVVIEDTRNITTVHSAVTPSPLAPAIKTNLPEIERATRYGWGNFLIKYKNKSFNEKNIGLVDQDFLQMFSFPLLSGNIETALSDPYSILLSEEQAQKYFGNEAPLGKTVTIKDTIDFTVAGVFKKVPDNSTFRFDILIPFKFLANLENIEFWAAWRYYTYIQMHPGTGIDKANQQITKVYLDNQPQKKNKLYLQPFAGIHLHSDLSYDISGRGDIYYVWVFATLAFFILIISCINFINLSTARSLIRSREIGLRKVIGAKKSDIIFQFFGETVLSVLLALVVALVLTELVIPVFNSLVMKNLSLSFFSPLQISSGIAAIAIFTICLSASYPALYLSSLQPVKILKGNSDSGRKNSILRKALVIIQFALTIILIVASIIVSGQLDYIQNKELGFDKDHIIWLPVRGNILANYESFKNELKQNPNIDEISASFQLPSNIGSSPGEMDWDGKETGNNVRINAGLVEYDYFETFGMKMAAGRTFSKEFSTDISGAYIVNETAVKAMRIQDPVGKRFSFWDTPGKIIGVVKDFHSQSLHKKINPIVLKLDSYWLNYVYVKVNSENFNQALAVIKNSWLKFNPDYPFEYHFLDDSLDRMYKSEQHIGEIFKYFTLLAIFIACLGLFGLASFITERRSKEVGIRKTLGASVPGIVVMLSKEFSIWILISNLIAWPLAWLIMNKWLQNFAYRIDLPWWVFVLSGSIALLIALLTVSSQAIKAAISNPLDSLRYE